MCAAITLLAGCQTAVRQHPAPIEVVEPSAESETLNSPTKPAVSGLRSADAAVVAQPNAVRVSSYDEEVPPPIRSGATASQQDVLSLPWLVNEVEAQPVA